MSQAVNSVELVVMGASAGGIEALGTLLPPLAQDFRVPIVVALHLPPDRPSLLSELFAPRCHLRVKEAEDKEPLEPGVIYFAPPAYHLLIEREKCFSLSVEEPVHYSRPSIDVLFESAADAMGSRAMGVLLTGANADGADGLATLEATGGMVVVQDPSTAAAREMPEQGVRRCKAPTVLTLEAMVPLLQAAGARRGAS